MFYDIEVSIMKSYKYCRNQQSIVPALISLFFILYGGFVSSYHHHENGRIKDECPICRFQHYGNNAVTVDYETTVEPLRFIIKPIIIPDELPVKPVIFSNAYPHAPPLFS
jgi:hypothetical protein